MNSLLTDPHLAIVKSKFYVPSLNIPKLSYNHGADSKLKQ